MVLVLSLEAGRSIGVIDLNPQLRQVAVLPRTPRLFRGEKSDLELPTSKILMIS